MRILLDESLPRKLKQSIVGHNVTTVQERGWAGKKNGELLRLMDGEIDVFVTPDQNLRYQQNLTSLRFGIIVLIANNNRLATLQHLMSEVHQVLATIVPGMIVEVGPPHP